MNLIITDQCNRSCPYCFALRKNKNPEDANKRKFNTIFLESVDWLIDFIRRSGREELKLLGGEPSLHPQLPEIVDRGLRQGLNITLFTNGIWPQSVRDYFQANTNPRVNFVFNINEPSQQNSTEYEQQQHSLSVAGKRAMIGFNIYRKDFDLRFVRELVECHGLTRQIRLGLSSPIVGADNQFLGNKDLRLIGRRLVTQLKEIEQYDILGALDCGFPLCMFAQEDLADLTLCKTPGPISICGSVIDVGPDLTAWPCFPLSGLFNIYLPDFENWQAVDAYYQEKTAPLRSFGSMDECITCKFLRRGQCSGGCLARTINAWMASGDTQLLDKLNARRSS